MRSCSLNVVVLLAMLLLWLSCTARATEPAAISLDDLDRLLLRAPVEFLVTHHDVDLATVKHGELQADFRPLHQQAINQGVSDRAYWLRLRLHNPGPDDVDWVLVHETSYLDQFSAWLSDSDGRTRHIQVTDRQPFPTRALPYRKPGFAATTATGDSQELYLRLAYAPGKADAMSLNLQLWEAERFAARVASENLLYGLFYGALLTLMLICLILASMIRHRVYLSYGLFLGATLLFWLNLNGLGFQYLWPHAVWWHNEGFHLVFILFSLTAIQFSRAFLGTRRQLPRCDRLLLVLSALGLAGWLLRLLGVYVPVLAIAATLLASLLLLPVLGWLLWRRGQSHAFWFALAWSLYAIALVLGLMSAYTSWLRWGMEPLLITQMASVVENLLLLLASAMRVLRLNRERRHAMALANTDALTGLGNRRMLSQYYQRLRSQFEGGGKPVFLILLDIDQFKQINDLHGHEAGDRVLLRVAEILTAVSRSSDACVRYGGEEFAILLLADDRDSALQLAERVRLEFQRRPTPVAGRLISHTLSAGLTAVFDRHCRLSEQEMILRADHALYEAKRGGRNRTVVMENEGLMAAPDTEIGMA